VDGLAAWSDPRPWAILGAVVLMVVFGLLVPSRFYKEARQDRDAFKDAALTAIQASAAAADQVSDLVGSVKTLTQSVAELTAKQAEILDYVKQKGVAPPATSGDRTPV
jgi:hypothetical protein